MTESKRWLIEPDGTGYFGIEDGPTEPVMVMPVAEVEELLIAAGVTPRIAYLVVKNPSNGQESGQDNA